MILGPHGIGKTSLLYSLNPEDTLFLNLEAGELAVQDWPGNMLRITSWQEAMDLACLASGPDDSLTTILDPAGSGNYIWPQYSRGYYEWLAAQHPEVVEYLGRFKVHFWDSISVASRMAWKWALGQPGSYSEKSGKQDTRGTYRIIGQEIVAWLTRIQHTPGKSIIVVGGLDEVKDEFSRTFWAPQIEGGKAAREMLGIFDQIISMVNMSSEDGNRYRAFVCHLENPWKYPAKDRSGRLDLIEKPHLGELIQKISGPRRPPEQRLGYAMPASIAMEDGNE